MIKKIKRIMQRVQYSLPFSLSHFWHKNVVTVKKLSHNTDLIRCVDCGKEFAVNHNVRTILLLPYEGEIKQFYISMNEWFD